MERMISAPSVLSQQPAEKAVLFSWAELHSQMEKQQWKKVLKTTGPGVVPSSLLPHEILQVQLCRVIALVKLRLFKQASDEFESLGNLDDRTHYYNIYPERYPNTKGSMVPFSLRVIQAELPSLAGNIALSIDLLFNLLHQVEEEISRLQHESKELGEEAPGLSPSDVDRFFVDTTTLSCLQPAGPFLAFSEVGSSFPTHSPPTISTWLVRRTRLSFSIASRLVQCRDYTLALSLLLSIAATHPKDALLWSTIGRLYLQMGNLKACQECFSRAEKLSPHPSTLVLMNRGQLLMAEDKYTDAIVAFDAVLQLDASKLAAHNNKAICQLFCCDVSAAIATLEGVVLRDAPTAHLEEVVIFNLCTLYDLQSDHSVDKKKQLAKLVVRHAGDQFDSSCLKLG